MKIEFTKHAEFKLELLKAHGFEISKDQVKDVIKNPDSVKKGKKGRTACSETYENSFLG